MKTREEILDLWNGAFSDDHDTLHDTINAFYLAARADGLEEAALLFPDQWPYGTEISTRIRALKEQMK